MLHWLIKLILQDFTKCYMSQGFEAALLQSFGIEIM